MSNLHLQFAFARFCIKVPNKKSICIKALFWPSFLFAVLPYQNPYQNGLEKRCDGVSLIESDTPSKPLKSLCFLIPVSLCFSSWVYGIQEVSGSIPLISTTKRGPSQNWKFCGGLFMALRGSQVFECVENFWIFRNSGYNKPSPAPKAALEQSDFNLFSAKRSEFRKDGFSDARFPVSSRVFSS